MVYEKSTKVYCCCGQYIVQTKAVEDKQVVCPRCGAKLFAPLKTPKIIVMTK